MEKKINGKWTHQNGEEFHFNSLKISNNIQNSVIENWICFLLHLFSVVYEQPFVIEEALLNTFAFHSSSVFRVDKNMIVSVGRERVNTPIVFIVDLSAQTISYHNFQSQFSLMSNKES